MSVKKDTNCLYCGSKAYGRSCPFGPKKTHCHVDAGQNKCIWCGSTAVGPGCPFNPFGNHHQRGYAFNPLALEAFHNGIIRGIVMKRLSESIEEKTAFKLGLIDSKGRQIREPKTIEERNSLTSTDKYILKLKQISENYIDLLNTKLYIEGNEEYTLDELKKMYPIELQCMDEISMIISSLFETVDKFAKSGVSSDKIEKIIAESVLNVENNNRIA
jgi:hypothetical protein